jgi:peptidoglycan/LPS O-acetylase OafA/YrhL
MTKKSFYFENLDSLRAIAAISVVLFHCSNWIDHPDNLYYIALINIISFQGQGGALGVEFFFILSGFLITYLMYKEEQDNKAIDIPFFYFRRIIRIWPLYYLTLLIGFAIYPLILSLSNVQYHENASPLLYILFATNFDHIINSSPSTGILGVQWSVAVEEQFYLIWPIIFNLLSRRKKLIHFLIMIVVLSEIYFMLSNSAAIKYYHFFSNLRLLTFGAILAYFAFQKSEKVNFYLNKISRSFSVIIYLFCLLAIFFKTQIISSIPIYKYFFHLLPILFFGYVILEQNFSKNSFLKLKNCTTLTWLGKISYGLYLTHMISIYIINYFMPQNELGLFEIKIVMTIGLTILISYLSYTYIETYFLSFRNKFR